LGAAKGKNNDANEAYWIEHSVPAQGESYHPAERSVEPTFAIGFMSFMHLRLIALATIPSMFSRIELQFDLGKFNALSPGLLRCVEYLVNHLVDLIFRNRRLAPHFEREQLP
jgi:hypothetical protein